MADYAISNVARRVVYTNTGVGPYAFTFEILTNTDIAVYRGSTLLTLTTDYTVIINANGTGSVTLVVAGTGNITIVGSRAIQRTSDYTTGGDLFASTLNTDLDSQTIYAQQVAETAERALKAPVTDPTDINMTLPSRTSRAGKTLAFDANGNPAVGEDIGNWRGAWASGTSYTIRDLVKDSYNLNIYRCNTAHTSSGSSPINTNADSAKWDLVIDLEAASISDVTGPASATDNAIVRFDGTTGKVIQNSVVTIADSTGDISGVGQLNATTIDATNIEVTNIKAKDGSAAASIADSTGVVTITASPVISSLTASQAVFTTAGKALVSNAITGTGNVVMSTSPTLVTPILGTPASGTVTNLTGTASININGTVGATTPTSGAFTTLSATGVTTVQAGSVSLPALTTSGDTNTGIFFPAADTIAFTEGGAESMRVDSSGRLLVGQTSTSSSNLLQVNSDARINSMTIGRGTGGDITNTALGYNTLLSNTTGDGCTAVGYGALSLNTTGDYNAAVGYGCLDANTSGARNTAVGYTALGGNTTGSNNVAVGMEAMLFNTTGERNVAVGEAALTANTTGIYNVAVGYAALSNNTTANGNTAFGYRSGSFNTTGSGNSSLGYESLFNNTGSNNTATGHQAGYSNTGSGNTFVGYTAGTAVTTGSNLTVIGNTAAASSVTATNEITLGNSSVATLRCQVTTITSLSDARDKKDITPLSAGLNFVNQLKPVSFTWNMRDGGKVGALDSGFVAQDLQQAQTNTNIYIPNLVNDSNPDKLEAGYGTLIPVLTKAIQELSLELNLVKKELAKLKESK